MLLEILLRRTERNVIKQGSNRVAILFWDGYIGIAPSLVNGAVCLSEAGYKVDILYRRRCQVYAPVTELDGHAHLHEIVPVGMRANEFFGSIVGFAKPNRDRYLLQRILLRLWFSLWLFRVPSRWFYRRVLQFIDHLQFCWASSRLVQTQRHAAVIGVDREGMLAAYLIAPFKRVRLIYWSLELYFMNEAKTMGERLLKRLERRASKSAETIIIQDQDRADALIGENQVDEAKVVLVPNSPMGPADTTKHRFFHDKFGLPPEQRVVAQIGGIDEGLCSPELAAASHDWPDGTCLVLHERMKRDPKEPFLDEIRRVGGDRVHLSLDPVPLEDVPLVVASCDVGLVFYRWDLGPNVTNIAGASGKLAYYLRCGLPVVAINFPGLVEVIEGHGCGVCVSSPAETGEALRRIFANYGFYQANAVRCFQDHYEFRRHFDEVLASLTNRRPVRSDTRFDSEILV